MKALKRVVSILFLIVFLSLTPLILLNRQNILDWWRLRGYEPSAKIEKLADDTAMGEHGRRLFFVQRPELNDRDSFNQNCTGFEQTIVLGCFVSGKGIYIFDVEDKRLEGIEEVTAAHEMLHVAYERLSGSERERVDGMTDAAFRALTDQRIKDVIASYQKRDQSVVPNELHSILATEVKDLPQELEEYYRKYFDDRSKVVDYSLQYESVFTDQQTRIKALGEKINSLESGLAEDRSTIDTTEAELVAEANRLNQLRSQRQIEEYNAAVPPYNARVADYRQLIDGYNADVRRLNKMIEEYNSLAVEQKNLFNAINSRAPEL